MFLADPPVNLAGAQLHAIIAGDGRLHVGQETWELRRHYHVILGAGEGSQNDVLNLINNGNHLLISRGPLVQEGQVAGYAISGRFGAGPQVGYMFIFNRVD